MTAARAVRRLLPALLLLLAAPAHAASTAQDPTQAGWFPGEPRLTPALVSDPGFGQRFSTPVEGQVYARPVVDDGVLVVATEANRVYGLDPEDGAQLWTTAFGRPFDASGPLVDCSDLQPQVGITSTPVVDPATHTAYLVSKEDVADPGDDPVGRHQLHALDTRTGQERPGYPVTLDGTADNAPGVRFEPTWQLQRPQLVLQDGVVYIGFGGHCDRGPFRGWMFGVRASDGQVRARWTSVTDPSSTGGGIWQAGTGPASDGPGQLLVATGNGFGDDPTPEQPTPGSTPPGGLSESVVRLVVQPDGTLRATDFFAPASAEVLDLYDADFASGGPVVLPDVPFASGTTQDRVVIAGKEGIVYSLDGHQLGGFRQGPGEPGDQGDGVGVLKGPGRAGVWGRPAAWPGPVPAPGQEGRGWLYVPATGYGPGALDVYRMVDGKPSLCTQSDGTAVPSGLGTSSAVISSDGRTEGSATAWMVSMPYRDGEGAQLTAYDATPTGCTPGGLKLLRTFAVGRGTKYASPTVTAGRVYVGTLEGRVLGFGAPAAPGLRSSGGSAGAVVLGQTGTATVHLRAEGAAVRLSGAGLSGDGFRLTSPVTAQTIPAGGTLDLAISFTPSAVGPVGGTLRLQTGSGEVPVALSGRGRSAGPYLEVSPSVIDVGTVEVGEVAEQSVVLESLGAKPVTVSAKRLPAAPFTVPDLPAGTFTLQPDERRVITVRFAPQASGATETGLEVTSDGSEPAVQRQVTLLGAAGVRGQVQVPAALPFGKVGLGSTASLPLDLVNTGDLPLPLTRFKAPGQGGAFSYLGGADEGGLVPPHGSLRGVVTFTPRATGAAAGGVEVNSDDGLGLRVVRLSGLGELPPPPATAPPATSTPPPADPTTTPPPPDPPAAPLPTDNGSSVLNLPGATKPPARPASAALVRLALIPGPPRTLRLTLRRRATVELTLARRRGAAGVARAGRTRRARPAGSASVRRPAPGAGRRLAPGRYRVAVVCGRTTRRATFTVR